MIASATLACVSCMKTQAPEPANEDIPTVPVTFRMCSAAETKITGVTAAYESRLESWICYVCAGRLKDAMDNSECHSMLHFMSTDSNHEKFNLPVGLYTAFVMANEYSYDNYDMSDFIYDGIIYDGVSYEMFSQGSLYMTGYCEFVVAAGTENNVTIHLQRTVGKVELQSLNVDFEDASYRTREVILKNIFLTNVAYCTQYFSFMEPDVGFYNIQGLWGSGGVNPWSDPCADAFVCDLDINHTLQSSGGVTHTPMTVPHVFYPFENLTAAEDDTRSESAEPRCTRLVVELLIDGVTHYYPVTIPMLRRNYCYNISQMTITGPGSADPERDVPHSVEVTFSTAENGWDSSFTIHEES